MKKSLVNSQNEHFSGSTPQHEKDRISGKINSDPL